MTNFPWKKPGTSDELIYEIDNLDLSAFVDIAARFGDQQYGYVVTPNVDHFVRLQEDELFRRLYRSAMFILLDSRVAAILIFLLKGLRLPVCPGSDLTAELMRRIARPSDRIVLIGGSDAEAKMLQDSLNLRNVRHHNPPMDFVNEPEELERCLAFIESVSPFRFCFIAVGSPKQEIIADLLKIRGHARGLALCVGASLNFLSGAQRRAPKWMQKYALEWLFRLVQNPRRMAGRYLVRGPRVFLYLARSRILIRTVATRIGNG
jgi:exopolysaccharide biosynthesis WecB/TagA/CpsF family protein